MTKTAKTVWVYVLSVLLALGVGGFSALLTMGNMDIYKQLQTPPLSPPSILFPIVWSALYILMGISAARIYLANAEKSRKQNSLTVYFVSLLFNFGWSIFFFNLRAFLFSFFWILALLFFILKTLVLYREIDRPAAYLQIPYALWVAFATYLNFGIYFLNR
jgi:tryptophan-rich sensory protein